MIEPIISLTKKLIAVPSVTSDIPALEEIFKIVKHELQEFPVIPFKKNHYPSLLYTNAAPENKQFKIILNAHLDVVQAEKNQYIPFINNGRLYGRGAYDMKAAAAVMILLFKELSKKITYPLALQIVSDEEDASLYGTQYQIEKGIRGSFVISGEGTNLKVINKAKGQMTLKLTALGKSSHSGYPWKGENAITKMHKAIGQLHKHYPVPKEEHFETIVHVTGINSNNKSYNNIPSHCEAYIDIRFITENEDEIVENIRSLIEPAVTVELLVKFPVNDTPSNNPYIQLLRKESKKLQKKELPFGFAHGASDIAFFKEIGCEGIEFGPIGENSHGLNEWVDIKSLEDYYHIFKNFLLSVPTL